MAKVLNEKRKLCIVRTNGPLHELGGIVGPILAPCQMSMRSVINLVQNGRSVYEVNPKNRTQMVKLTIKNVQANNFPEKERFVMPEEKKAPVKPNVVKKDEAVKATQDNITAAPVEEKLDKIVVDVVTKEKETAKSDPVEITPVQKEEPKKWEKNNGKNSDFSKK